MKKSILLLWGFLPMISIAQERNKFSFYVQGGYLSSNYMREAMQKGISSKTESRDHTCVILNAGFQVRVSKAWRIGPAFAYDHFGTKHRSVKFSVFNYLLKADRIWKETSQFNLYSGLALGVTTSRQVSDNIVIGRKVNMAYQIQLAGASIKLDHFELDVNFGWGVSGLAAAGIRYNF